MRTTGEAGRVEFTPFNDMRYSASARGRRGLSIKIPNLSQDKEGPLWMIPTELHTPFNMSGVINYDGSRTYTFREATDILRVDSSFANEGIHGLKGIGRKQPIHRVIVDKSAKGQLVYSTIPDVLTDEDYERSYFELPRQAYWYGHQGNCDRVEVDVGINRFGLLQKLFSLENNDLALNTALRCGVDHPKIYLRGNKIYDYMPIHSADDTLITIKFKDGTYLNTTVKRLISGHVHNGIDVSGLFGTNEDWARFSPRDDMYGLVKTHPMYPNVEWLAFVRFHNSIGVDVYHELDDRESILNIFDPINRHDLNVIVDKDFNVGDDGVKALNLAIARQLQKDYVNVISINGDIQGIECDWDGNLDEEYTGVHKWCGTICDLNDELYQLLTGEPKPSYLAARIADGEDDQPF